MKKDDLKKFIHTYPEKRPVNWKFSGFGSRSYIGKEGILKGGVCAKWKLEKREGFPFLFYTFWGNWAQNSDNEYTHSLPTPDRDSVKNPVLIPDPPDLIDALFGIINRKWIHRGRLSVLQLIIKRQAKISSLYPTRPLVIEQKQQQNDIGRKGGWCGCEVKWTWMVRWRKEGRTNM